MMLNLSSTQILISQAVNSVVVQVVKWIFKSASTRFFGTDPGARAERQNVGGYRGFFVLKKQTECGKRRQIMLAQRYWHSWAIRERHWDQIG